MLFEAVLSIIAWIGIALSTVFWAILIAGVYLVHRWLDPQLRIAHRMTSLWGRGLVAMAPGCRVRIVGRENIPADRPVIFVSNHQSYSDVPILYFLRGQFKWIADERLFRIPFFGWAMRMAGYIPVQQGDRHSAVETLGKAKAWLAHGISIFLFPEGTRSHTGAFGRFQTGGFRLAVETGTPVVPVVLVGTRQLLPRGSWIFRIGVKPQIHLLPPIAPDSADSKEIHPLAKGVRAEMERVYRRALREIR